MERYFSEIDALVSLTERSTEWIRHNLATSGMNLSTVPNMNPDGFYLQSSCQSKVIIAAGRVVRQKRFDHLVEAFSLISDDFPDWSLRIFGEGRERRKVERIIEERGLSNQVAILPFVTDLKNELAKASIAAMTSVNEGLPLVGLEALATGVPYISYDIPTGPSEIIDDGENGYLISEGDTPAFAEKLRILMSDPTLRRRMGQAARASSIRYSEGTVSDQWEQLFRQLLDGKRRPRAQDLIGPAEDTTTTPLGVAPSVSASQTLTSVLDLLAKNNVPWAPVPAYGECPAIAIQDSSIERFCAALSRSDQELTVKLNLADGSDPRWLTDRRTALETITAARPHVISIITDAPLDRAMTSVRASFVDVEVWGATTDGSYKPPRRNHAEDEVQPAFFKVHPQGLSIQDYGDELESVWSTPDFPVDMVYTWVDGNDLEWQARKNQYTANPNVHEEALDSTRFQDREELRYSLRSVAAYAPWVRRIYIVTDHQVPYWLNTEDPQIHLIDHTDIFPDTSVLPTFNSQSIETALHRIPGLAEHFIAMNDDFILRNPVKKEQFFTSAGQPKFFTSSVKIGNNPDPAPHIQAAQNNRKIIQQRFGKTITQCLLHAPYAHLKSVWEEIEREYPDEVEGTRASRFRSPDDVSLCSSLAQYYGYFTQRYVTGSIRYTYLQVNAGSTVRQIEGIRDSRSLHCFAVGENTGAQEQEDTNVLLHEFFETIIPWKSQFEL